ncbi:DUF167 domain-containing protein [Candidatus Saccharibacteria bacterium]|nr:DUF167 domain-containing protein [Candidatus Saccharibacteria bacterium]
MKYAVLVKPGSKVEGVFNGPSDGELIVRTHARAHDGEANAAVIKILAKHFGVAKSCIEIVSGTTSRHKIVEIIR